MSAYYAEPVRPTGGLTGQGARRLLGRPMIPPLGVLVREALQNSLDASQGRQFQFEVAVERVEDQSYARLNELLVATAPSQCGIEEDLQSIKSKHLLILRDSGTTGMGGPLTAGLAVNTSAIKPDWVNFLFKIGQASDSPGAGTYGYGKSAYYNASMIGLICIYTRCTGDSGPETRLIFSRLGNPFKVRTGPNRGEFTGRQWWGKEVREEAVLPFLGAEADSIAASLGVKPFGGGQFGTAIAIVGAKELSAVDMALRELFKYALWTFWPAMIPTSSSEVAQLSLRVVSNGMNVPGTTCLPTDHPELMHFCTAYRAAISQSSLGAPEGLVASKELCQQQNALGRLGLAKFPVPPNGGGLDSQGHSEWIPLGRLGHVACTRKKMVVCYKKLDVADPHPESRHWCGVYVPNDDVERVFADAEPPSHDEWRSDYVADESHRKIVRSLFRQLPGVVRDWIVGPNGAAALQPTLNLGELSNTLGRELGLGGRDGSLPGDPRGGGRGGGRRSRPPATCERVSQELLEVNGKACQKIVYDVTSRQSCTLQVGASVVLADGSRESSPPRGAERPVIDIETNLGPVEGEKILIPHGAAGEMVVFVTIPGECCASVDIKIT